MSSKRSSSEYCFEPQLKKQVCDESEEYKQSIYDKTIQKLYEGAKLNVSTKPVIETAIPTKSSASHSDIKRGLKQISLNSNGQLESKNKVINPKEYCPALPEVCSFCERLGCFTTLLQCKKCEEKFCSNCSFSTYSQADDQPLCISCFK